MKLQKRNGCGCVHVLCSLCLVCVHALYACSVSVYTLLVAVCLCSMLVALYVCASVCKRVHACACTLCLLPVPSQPWLYLRNVEVCSPTSKQTGPLADWSFRETLPWKHQCHVLSSRQPFIFKSVFILVRSRGFEQFSGGGEGGLHCRASTGTQP